MLLLFSLFCKITVEPLMSHGLFYRSPCYLSKPDRIRILAVYGRVRKLSDAIKNILICVQKMNGGLTGLERHEGE